MTTLNIKPLLPCPLCGKPAELKTDFENNGLYRSHIKIACTGCGANVHSTLLNTGTRQLRQLQYDSLALKWNARVKPSHSYAAITEHGELVDYIGPYARYWFEGDTVWVCEDCQETHVDPYEQDCACFTGEAA